MWVRSLGWEDPLEQGMATHSSILPWRIPWTEDPGGLQSIGLQRIRHDWSDLACTWFNTLILYIVLIKWNYTLFFFFFAFYPSTPWMSCSPWGHKELDTTERLNNTIQNCTLWLLGVPYYWRYIMYLTISCIDCSQLFAITNNVAMNSLFTY